MSCIKHSLYSNLLKIAHQYIKNSLRVYCTKNFKVDHDYNYLCNPLNTTVIKENIARRKQKGDIRKVVKLWNKLKEDSIGQEERKAVEEHLYNEALLIPNKTSPHVFDFKDSPRLIKEVNKKPTFDFEPKSFSEGCSLHNSLATENLSLVSNQRSYVFRNYLADLEKCLIRYTISSLAKKGYLMITVPDLLYSDIIEGCGMLTKGTRSQVYHLSNMDDVCLSGTSEMALGGFFRNKTLSSSQLPLKMMAVSRCFRQEVGMKSKEKGLYRVHAFTKVEMFGVTHGETELSHKLYEEFVDIQCQLFADLGLHFKVYDMPPHELGSPAYSKTDIEAYIPGREEYGEISSTSNCTDYQSRRLGIRYRDKKDNLCYVHTVNGTACAIPRMLIALVTCNQQKNGNIAIPKPLQSFMKGQTFIKKDNNCHTFKYFKGHKIRAKIV